MRIIRFGGRSFDLDTFLKKPLFAHLSTMSEEGPRDSPVWFHWERERIWIIGITSTDSFPKRLQKNPKCAIGIVDFDLYRGLVLHAGFRGHAEVKSFDHEIAYRLLSRYLGPHEERWDPRFRNLDDSNVLICFRPETVVIRDQSYVPAKEME
ncbi:pyridoxamine 5'-phosphate oxidase family protein [Paenibacillus dendritiformis]|uniref:pyridoxamine 5'-phosphate oxidase family protein n=1 Tax=Paenibacillus dendritiformis TaxID=130049 RepID=UPI00142EF340|nr:pyridoxamine 5'-phosphate oxidase family protein [Paenibacillus dendritiformis]CAH8770417.1 pyridoxamine 5'-phosphate oxidase family protein [Paenibacillus dendritiformis]